MSRRWWTHSCRLSNSRRLSIFAVLRRGPNLRCGAGCRPDDRWRWTRRLTRTEVTVSKGGLLSYTKELGDPMQKGEVIALLRDPYGDVVEEVVSQVDGWILAYPPMHNQSAATGDFAAFLAFPHED